MLLTELKCENNFFKYLVDKEISIELAGWFEFYFEEFTGFRLTRDVELTGIINRVFSELVPVAWPIDRRVELYMNTYFLLKADTMMKASPLNLYVIYKMLLYIKEKADNEMIFDPLWICPHIIDVVKEEQLSDVDQIDLEDRVVDYLEDFFTSDGVIAKLFSEFDHEVYDAMSREELEELTKSFRRELISLKTVYEMIATEQKGSSLIGKNGVDSSANMPTVEE